MSEYTTITDFPDYEINRSGSVRRADGTCLGSPVSPKYNTNDAEYVSLRRDGRTRQRCINVLLVETFGPGAAQQAGYPEPDMRRVQVQRELAERPRSGKSLGRDGYRKYTRRCHDCGKPTSNYRCEECWIRIRGFGASEAQNYHFDPYSVHE